MLYVIISCYVNTLRSAKINIPIYWVLHTVSDCCARRFGISLCCDIDAECTGIHDRDVSLIVSPEAEA